jgi:phage terminase Nu1 subunit (DNA packaging protein)
MMGKKVNQTELAEILGKSDVTLWEWARDNADFPILKRAERGEANEYDTEAVIAWLIERAVHKVQSESQKDRLARLQGDMLEIELQRERGSLVPTVEVEPVWQQRVLAAAAFLHSQPSRLAGMLEAVEGEEAKRQLLKSEFADFLTRLGAEGEGIQADLEELLAKVSTAEADAFLKRIAGHDDKPNAAGPAQ